MEKNEEIIYDNILENISDGLILVKLDGTICMINNSAQDILNRKADDILGKKLAELMMEDEENDDFFECILDAVYTKELKTDIIAYNNNGEKKRLRIVCSMLMDGTEKVALIVMFSDLTELITLSERNQILNKKLREFIDRFVQVMIGAIEARTPYNANHTKSMVAYAERFLEWLKSKGLRKVDDTKSPFLSSVWLHDIGKLIVPRSVMDKATRLGEKESDVRHRIEVAILNEKIRELQDPSIQAEAEENIRRLKEADELVVSVNNAGFLDDETLEKVKNLKSVSCLNSNGEKVPLLSDYEYDALSVRRGTLTSEERKIIESHVVHTRKMLEQMGFEAEFGDVAKWAGSHHEYLDGSGYPDKLKADNIAWESRILTIIDIYDSLTADDRPYKPSMSPEKAFKILFSMRDEGKLDGEILQEFYDSKAWVKE